MWMLKFEPAEADEAPVIKAAAVARPIREARIIVNSPFHAAISSIIAFRSPLMAPFVALSD
jgi:site-specific recombinase